LFNNVKLAHAQKNRTWSGPVFLGADQKRKASFVDGIGCGFYCHVRLRLRTQL